jgi:hypothetical protein
MLFIAKGHNLFLSVSLMKIDVCICHMLSFVRRGTQTAQHFAVTKMHCRVYQGLGAGLGGCQAPVFTIQVLDWHT